MMLPDPASVVRRLSAVLAGALALFAATAVAAQASYGEIEHFGGEKGTGAGQFEPASEAEDIGVDPKEQNSVFVLDLPDEKNEYRIQKFEKIDGKYKAVASVKFKPADAEGPEEPDVVEGLAVDAEKGRVYALAVEDRPEGEKRIDALDGAASQLFAFSTKQTGETLLPAEDDTEGGGVLAGTKALKPLSNTLGVSLLNPTGIAVDPSTHDVVILGQEGTGANGEELLTSLERVSETGVVGERYLDTTNFFENEELLSLAVAPTGKVYVENYDELYEIPSPFSADTAPNPFVIFEPLLEKVASFPGSPGPLYGGSLSIGEEGTIYTKASIFQQVSGKTTGPYPAVLEFNAKGEEEGWTGGQSVASVGENGPCKISFTAVPQIAAGDDHSVFVYEPILASPKVLEFGPGGKGCPTATATVPTATVNGVLVPESEAIPSADNVTLSSTLTGGNALSVEWSFGDGSEPTVTGEQYQTAEVAHQFAKGGELEITEKIHTDTLEEPLIEEHRKIKITPPKPTAVTGEASPVANTTATLKGTVNPNGEDVTSCKFEYGTNNKYGSTAACAPSSLGTGKAPVAVTAAIASLAEHTKYFFRLVATGTGGTSEGSEATFTTGPKAPTVVTDAASVTGETAATLNATVAPEGGTVTVCKFEYGTTSSYGASVPCSSLPAGTGTNAIAVSASLAGLASATTYHFRIVATNSAETSYGADKTFTTNSPPTQTTQTQTQTQPSTTTPATTPTETPPPPPAPPLPLVAVSGSSATVSPAGALAIKASCPAAAGSCSGTVTLKTAKAVVASVGHAAKGKAAILTLATASFMVSGGQIKAITLHLSAKARALLARSHVVVARATIVAHDPAGGVYTTSVTVTLRAAAAKHHG
jgi:hypothetical protein